MTTKEGIWTLVVSIVVSLALGLSILWLSDETHGWRAEAVEAGHAEWYVDDDVKKWRWKKCENCSDGED